MRSRIANTVRNVARSYRDQPTLFAQRRPYICASCRAAETRQSPSTASPTLSHRRTFATSRRSQQQENASQQPQQSQQQSQPSQSHYDFFPQTFPSGPPPKTPFSPDLKQLRREFLQLQAKAHPDLAPQDQKRYAEALSMRINEAYKTLQDPLRRAQYLLSQQGIDVEDESAKLDGEDGTLLMEVMEAREAVEEVEDEEGLVGIREENNERIRDSVGVLEDAFSKGDTQRAAQEAIRLRYWMNIEESIQGWEKGKGGGIIHH